MGRQTGIGWTGATWNPWQGCRTKSEGCRNCYMFTDMRRYGKDPKDIHRSARATFDAPLKWQQGYTRGHAGEQDRLVFTCSWSDWFIEEADAWRDDAWAIIRRCPDLVFQILTKRADRIADHLPADWGPTGYPNCWLGVSCEDQARADERIPHLLQVPAAVRFLSVEPLLGPIRLPFFDPSSECERLAVVAAAEAFGGIPEDSLNAQLSRYYTAAERGIHWVIVGGESGPKARRCHLDWVRSIRNQCQAAGVPVFVKQLGSLPVCDFPSRDNPEMHAILDLDDRKGGDIDEFPEDLRIRQFPNVADDSCPDLFSHVHG